MLINLIIVPKEVKPAQKTTLHVYRFRAIHCENWELKVMNTVVMKTTYDVSSFGKHYLSFSLTAFHCVI